MIKDSTSSMFSQHKRVKGATTTNEEEWITVWKTTTHSALESVSAAAACIQEDEILRLLLQIVKVMETASCTWIPMMNIERMVTILSSISASLDREGKHEDGRHNRHENQERHARLERGDIEYMMIEETKKLKNVTQLKISECATRLLVLMLSTTNDLVEHVEDATTLNSPSSLIRTMVRFLFLLLLLLLFHYFFSLKMTKVFLFPFF